MECEKWLNSYFDLGEAFSGTLFLQDRAELPYAEPMGTNC